MSEEMFFRHLSFRSEDVKDDGVVRVIASTDAACDFGGYREVLEHKPGAVDFSSCRTALLNHDRNQMVGGVKNITVSDGKCLAEITVSPEARAQTGVKVIDLIRSGALAGVSIGYGYDDKDAAYNDETRTITAKKWRLREISFTPTQADMEAHTVRSLPESFKPAAKPVASTKESRVSDDNKTEPQVPAVDINKAENEAVRKASEVSADRAKKEATEVAELARSHDLDPVKYLMLSRADASASMLRDLAEKRKTEVKQPAVRIDVSIDGIEKKRDAIVGGLLASGGVRDEKLQAGNPMVGRSILDMVRFFAIGNGENPADWSRSDLAHYALGQLSNMSRGIRSSANVTSSNFTSFVLVNAMDKAVMNGFQNFASETTYGLWTSTRFVSDFKQVTGAALDSGNLTSTAEDVAFPELTKAEGGYNATLGMYGATISLTYQALVNDDLGEFMSLVQRAGAIAQRTIDAAVYTTLANGTYTSNLTTGAAIGTAGSLDKARSDFVTKTGAAGAKLLNTPRFLIHPPGLSNAVAEMTGKYIPPGSTNAASVKAHSIEPIESPYLTSTTWYLAGNPATVDTVKVIKLNGVESPIVQEYDAGAIAARKWKIMMPFTTVLVSFTPSGGSLIVPGIQQATP